VHRPPACAGGGPPWTSVLLQSSITGTPCRPYRLLGVSTTLPLLDSFCPTTHVSRADPFADSGSLRCRVPRTGFDYPLRDVHRPAYRRVKRTGASLSFTLQGFPLVAIGTPLGALAFMPLPAAPHLPGGRCGQPGRLQGLLPATSPFCRRSHKGSGRRSLLGVHPSRACSRSSWRALCSRRLPSRPWTA